ncbi:MAG: cysteine desulfurase family protein [Cyanobacteriota bacterium]|nr:cysteine desulfurase family protein [Cyanobacteriota bacterium]
MTIQILVHDPIYLDYHSTTPVDRRVADRILHQMTIAFGNASSTDHIYGDEASKAIRQARRHVAQLVGAFPKDIIFTSGATESINLAIQGSIAPKIANPNKPRVAVCAAEHKAVLDTCNILEKQGKIELLQLPVNSQAQIDLDRLQQACDRGLDLLCVMAANNEVGTIYPVEQIGAIARQYRVSFLCDASQAAGKIPIHCEDWGITYLAISAHKLYGPQGVGALVANRRHPLQPILFGGGHQKRIRPGTLNVPGIVGLGEACRLRQLEMAADETAIASKRDRLQRLLQAQIPGLQVNGDRDSRLAGNLHISIPEIPNSAIIARVRHRLAISRGSACSSGVEAPSHVLQGMNLSEEVIEGALRIGIGKFTTEEEIDRAANILVAAVDSTRNIIDE